MKSRLRLLHLEDNCAEAELIGRQLAAQWPDCRVVSVDNEAHFTAALETEGFDLILADYALPTFHGLAALALARRLRPETPLVFLSGAIGDEVAVESLKAGATDYVLKDRPARLVPAIQRALEESAERARRRQVEEQLRRSQEQYHDLFENANDLIQSVTAEGRFMYVNRAWRQILGYSAEDVAGLTIFDVVHPDYHGQCRERFQWLKPDEEVGAWNVIFLTKGGGQIYVQGNTSARFVAGELAATRGIFHDVTEEHTADAALQQAVRQYETLVNAIDGIVWQADRPGLRFTFVSQQAERLLGYPVRDWLEEPAFWQNHIHPEDRERAVALCTQLTPTEKYRNFEYRMVAADGRVVWLRDIVSVHAEKGEAPRLQGIMVDITARKQVEEKMCHIHTKLEQANRDLLGRNQEIQNFYHTLSHELKTPLTSAREFVSIVMDGLAGSLNETQMQYLGIARDSCLQLQACMNDLLDATRLETGKLTLELKPVAVEALVSRVMTSLGPSAAEKKIALSQETQPGLPEVPLDERRMMQVLANLLNNALKHTPADGQIVVQVGEAPGHPDWLQVSVRDTGCGIPKEEQDHIFDRLYQVKTGDATTEQGVGLGLHLCRELVQLHGGNIWVVSEPGKGSTFSFVVPKNQQLIRPSLLVVDDDPEMCDLLHDLLTAGQYNVRAARNGREALAQMRRQTPDIVLLDLAMPEMDGPATLKEIRHHWGPIPVIVHTGYAESELVKQALAFSPFTLLAKPCTADQLLETVRKIQRSGDTTTWKKNHFGLRPLLRN